MNSFSKVFILILSCFCLASLPLAAQTSGGKVTITGTVVDESSTPVIGAAVFVKDNASLGGAMTDAAGEFSLTVPAGSVLQVSCVGYQTWERVASGPDRWFITLLEDTQLIEETVVVGYGVQKRQHQEAQCGVCLEAVPVGQL